MSSSIPDSPTRRRRGSVESFDESWKELSEANRYHFARGEPANQIQFAFQNHWRVFRKILGEKATGTALEVGCGRGSMGAFFAESGYDTHLLDFSVAALRIARANFRRDELEGAAVAGDALALPYRDGSFDAVVSIGLLEHFEDVRAPVLEQLRVLRPGGVFLGYVVPERPVSVQTLAAPINFALKVRQRARVRSGLAQAKPGERKQPLFRNSFGPKAYETILRDAGIREHGSFGMFPVPLVSHAPAFPFSLNDPTTERRIVATWRALLRGRAEPWTCPVPWGLAFLVWARR